MRRSALLVPLVAVGALGAGCGSSSANGSGSGTSTTPSAPVGQQTVTDTVEPPTTATPRSSAPGGGGRCATSALTVSLGTPQGAAGSEIYPVHLTNASGASCTLGGFPGVSYVAPGNGIQVGPGATRSTTAGHTVTLAPGAEATALVKATRAADFPVTTCEPTAVSGFRVYPPGDTDSAYVAFAAQQTACSAVATLQVQPVVAGGTGT